MQTEQLDSINYNRNITSKTKQKRNEVGRMCFCTFLETKKSTFIQNYKELELNTFHKKAVPLLSVQEPRNAAISFKWHLVMTSQAWLNNQ